MNTKIQIILRTISRDGQPVNDQEIVGELELDRRLEAIELLSKERDDFHIKVRSIDDIQKEAQEKEE